MSRVSGAREKVERAAVDLFATNGVDGVSIADIAVAAGVSQGALYRHYASKEELAWAMFSSGYLRMGQELEAMRAEVRGFGPRIAAMTARFCALFDEDAAQFRFMLLAQHGFLQRIDLGTRTPVEVIVDTVKDAIIAQEVGPVDPEIGAAVIMGVILQTVTFHIYGRHGGDLSKQAPALARAAIAAVKALS